MMVLLSSLTFLQPLALLALLTLPLLWLILRITPPAPKTVFFPAARLLLGLQTDDNTPSKTPWWILLLRLLIAALVIIALARPVLNPAQPINGNGALRLIIDNSWASGSLWNTQMNAAEEAIIQAGRAEREIYILPTTYASGATKHRQFGPASAADALSYIRGLKPNAWPSDYEALSSYIDTMDLNKTSIDTIWLSHGLDEGRLNDVAKSAQRQGSLSYISPSPEKLPLLLRPSRKTKNNDKITIDIEAPDTIANNLPISLQVLGEQGAILDIETSHLNATQALNTVEFGLPETIHDQITQFKITGSRNAGGLYLLDDQTKRKTVGIAAQQQEASSAPLIEASYYLKRALEPFSNIETEEIETLITQDMPAIILPDVAAMPSETLNALQKWVKDGGLLIRFAGNNMADARSEQFLLPVMLRAGGRSLSGALSWDEPQSLAPFNESSPLYGLNIPKDIAIKQQVLADPSQDMEGKIWATLTDGTPFITAKQEGKGLIVLIHTTANTDWSNFPLSGLYVSVLKRITQMAGQTTVKPNVTYKTLDPLLVMDGFGNLTAPDPHVKPLSAQNLNKVIPSSLHPPGLYGKGSVQFALNIGDNLTELVSTPALPTGVARATYANDYEIDLSPYILFSALTLFCIDWIVMMLISGTLIRRFSLFIVAIMCLGLPHAHAANQNDIFHAKGFHLAHIATGDDTLDTLTARGLTSLSKILTQRTSVEPMSVVSLDPETDTLAFFPIIYWPISETQKHYSDKALRNVQAYLNQGGTILFDTRNRDQNINSPGAIALRRITASLDIPPVTPIPQDHVLTRSYYLLKDFPGRYKNGTLWVEKHSISGRDNVSSVIIGSNDWIGAWSDMKDHKQYGTGGQHKQNEMALRFGVNIVMYALTGNYKADQVHIPHILKRLGK